MHGGTSGDSSMKFPISIGSDVLCGAPEDPVGVAEFCSRNNVATGDLAIY